MNSENNNHNDDSKKATSYIHASCKPDEKAMWVKAAQREGLKLTQWIVKSLNRAAKQT